MAGGKNKVKGRVSAYAFFVRTCREEVEKQSPGQKILFAEFSQLCAAKWKDMSAEDKKWFQDMADNDRKRYNSEIAKFKEETGGHVSRKSRAGRGRNAPKKALTAFFWFTDEQRSKVKARNPEWKATEVSKELSRMWNNLDELSKEKYEALAEKDRERYQKEMEAYRAGASA